MGLWVDDLLHEYTHYKKELRRLAEETKVRKEWDPKAEEDLTNINSMMEDMRIAIQWMETGQDPNSYRGMDKRGVYQMNALAGVWDCIPDITEQLEDAGRRELTQHEIEKLTKIFASFSLRERECYIMHVGQEMSWEKIANELGIGKTTVQMYIKRAKMKINEING